MPCKASNKHASLDSRASKIYLKNTQTKIVASLSSTY